IMKISELEEENRPREKAKRKGIRNLTNQELLAIIIGSGTRGISALDIGDKMIQTFHTLRNMSGLGMEQFEEFEGISSVRAQKFEAIFELQRRCLEEKRSETYENSENLYNLYKDRVHLLNDEEIIAIFYSPKFQFQKEINITQFGTLKVGVNIRHLIKTMFQLGSKYLVIMHNHLGDNKEPSQNDLMATMKISKRLSDLGLCLLDSMVVSESGYYSFKEEGFLN
ncbi:MAG: hypothetical protein MJ238_05545, partial [Bacilli bacterium]|nr:hypothetical protein [Bacilli bacterium]